MLKTTLHAYYFDTAKPEDLKTWKELRARLIKTNGECFETWGSGSHYRPDLDGPVNLEDGHLFENQWNTESHRVFDWAQDHPIDFRKAIKRGHYLDITDEMREARRNRMSCGYCGKQEPAQKGNVFCPHCIGSAYLKESDLHLLRMHPVSDGMKTRAPLSTAESAHMLPIYREAQIHGVSSRDKMRLAKQREDLAIELARVTDNAHTKHDGFMWCMDRGISIDNLIFYSHTGRFSFGWINKLSVGTASKLRESLAGFPFPYDIEEGRS